MESMKKSDRIATYFSSEWKNLLLVTLSGVIYNVGLLAGPLFEGKLAQCLMDILGGNKVFADMVILASIYILTIAVVQAARYAKRLYVRKFANNISRSMKHVLYGNLVHKSKAEMDREDTGSVMTKAISDVNACAEGMRKFTTEVFDTGVALAGYIVMLLVYDWRLGLVSLIFPPISYVIAEKMKTVVQKSGAAYKESAGRLNSATMDRVGNAISYRVFGCEEQRNDDYNTYLEDYEKSAVRSNVWVQSLPPIYNVLSMISVIFIIYFGGKNVVSGAWNIAAFTTFLSCFAKLSVKSSKAAKLFNSVHQAQVSWKRIKPLMAQVKEDKPLITAGAGRLDVRSLTISLNEGEEEIPIAKNLTFSAKPGDIIGITGPVACGKSTLGKAFLREVPYTGEIRFGGTELHQMDENELYGSIGYLGHDTELMSDTLVNNIMMGDEGDVEKYISMVQLTEEAASMPKGADSQVGTGGIMLSGGQQQRVALARTLAHPKPVLVLDDPFSALDRDTEEKIFSALRHECRDRIVLLISHRLYLFPETDQVIWMDKGCAAPSTHKELMESCPGYRQLFLLQQEVQE